MQEPPIKPYHWGRFKAINDPGTTLYIFILAVYLKSPESSEFYGLGMTPRDGHWAAVEVNLSQVTSISTHSKTWATKITHLHQKLMDLIWVVDERDMLEQEALAMLGKSTIELPAQDIVHELAGEDPWHTIKLPDASWITRCRFCGSDYTSEETHEPGCIYAKAAAYVAE